ncbi:DUF397 domain-containing protein [Streptomyces sp. HSW2009]|uniref:DUF397 domain-containing protein n=1 Tax=Streptomyces sp. HSW2009 TaxID=3142890 RepID=UPI0032F0511B
MAEQWIKSSYSNGGGNCIEWAPGHVPGTGVVPVRDSKAPHGPALAFDPPTWSAFVAVVKSGGFVA